MFLLPIIVFILFCIAYFARKNKIIESIIVSWLFVTLYSWIIMELFGVFAMVNTAATMTAWSLACLVLVIYNVKSKAFTKIADSCRNGGTICECLKEHRYSFICLGVFCGLIVLLSILRSQRLLDNLYHRLPRIMHWIQDGKVGYFSSWTPGEVTYSRLVEYLMAQIYLLKGSDRFITIVQAGAYLCSGCCIYGISRKIGTSFRFAILSVWIFLLSPMVIVETISTQTDVAAGCYLLSFVYFLLDFIHARHLEMNKAGAFAALCLALSVMFGYLAKPTVCFTMVVFFVWMCVVRLIRRDKLTVLLQYMVIGILVVVILFLPDVVRNYEYANYENTSVSEQSDGGAATGGAATNGAAAGVDTGAAIADAMLLSGEAGKAAQTLTKQREFVAVCISNLAANASTRCFPRINDILAWIVNKCESLMDYYTQEAYGTYVTTGFGETNEPSPAIMWLLLFAWICVLTRFSKTNREQFLYLLCATIGMILQAGLMDFTFFRQRYLIGVMAVVCAAFGAVLENIRVSMKTKLHAMTSIITVCSFGAINGLTYEIPYVIFGLQGEGIHQYLYGESDTEMYYQLLLDHINEKGYTTVGLYGTVSFEYILWQEIDALERMEHVNVTPAYPGYKMEDMNFYPECIVKEMPSKAEGAYDEIMYCHGREYVCEWKAWGDNGRNYVVFVPGE